MPENLNIPPINGLQKAMDRERLPIPAGKASPVTLRAMSQVSKDFPQDMKGVDVNENMDDPIAFTNTLATTPIPLPPSWTSPRDPKSFNVNAGVGMLYPQKEVEGIVAHELEHIRQNSTRNPIDRLMEQDKPYRERPDEIAGFNAQLAYLKKHGQPSNADINYGNSFIDAIKGLRIPGRD